MAKKTGKSKKNILSLKDKNKIVTEYTPFVRFIAKKISKRLPANVDLEELVSSGMMGLVDAADKYDSSRDNKFKTYAEFRIRGAILDELRSQDWIPRSIRDKAKVLERAHLELESELGRAPKEKEVAERLNLSMKGYFTLTAQVSSVSMLSIDEYTEFSNNDRRSLFEILNQENSPFSEMSLKSSKKVINKAIEELPERQRIVLSLYYYEGFSLKKIGSILNVTESRISQLHARAILRLKVKLNRMVQEKELLSA